MGTCCAVCSNDVADGVESLGFDIALELDMAFGRAMCCVRVLAKRELMADDKAERPPQHTSAVRLL